MKKLKIKIEDILFWILIAGIIAVALWLLSGSPPETNALIAVTVFIAASEILLWRTLFLNDKKTAIGFERVKLRFDKIDEKLEKISNQLNKKNFIKRRK